MTEEHTTVQRAVEEANIMENRKSFSISMNVDIPPEIVEEVTEEWGEDSLSELACEIAKQHIQRKYGMDTHMSTKTVAQEDGMGLDMGSKRFTVMMMV